MDQARHDDSRPRTQNRAERLLMTPRRSTPRVQPSIELHIEEIVLRGLSLSQAQGREVQAAIEAELTNLLTEQGLRDPIADVTPQSKPRSIQLPHANAPADLGYQIAKFVYASLSPVATASHPTPSKAGESR